MITGSGSRDTYASALDRLKGITPSGAQRTLRAGLVRYAQLSAPARVLPDFLIIGTKRGGTTSLWNYLLDHPLVPRMFPAPNTKSTHYFEENWRCGPRWFRSHFPTQRRMKALQRRHGSRPKVGEASPLYMFDPRVPARVHALLPQVRPIALVRDPVERAFSHWKERRGNGLEPLDFADALAAEQSRVAGEYERLAADQYYFSEPLDWYTYRARGRYIEHLRPWLELFGDQLLVLVSEDLYSRPERTYQAVLDHIGLPAHRPPSFEVYNDRRSAPIDPAIRAELAAHFAPFNAALEQALGRTLPWE
jgi:hypothetical protein